MNRQSLGALIALNVTLLVSLVIVTLTPQKADAQPAFGRSQYVMVTGETTARPNEAAVYIFDLASAQVAAVFFSTANNRFEVVGTYDMAGDLTARPSSGDRR